MAFYGCDFTFDGKKASDFGLMLYNVGSYGQDDVDFSVGEIAEDRIARRYDSLLYGLEHNEPLMFTLVFGIDPDNLAGEAHLTRAQVADIMEWLTGHRTYKELTIDQDDMEEYCYHAMVTGLKLISDGGLPTAFSAEITCDSPFAYIRIPGWNTWWFYSGGGSMTSRINNRSKIHGYCYPVITVNLSSAASISFTNASDGGRVMRLDNIPAGSDHTVRIDCRNQIITSSLGYNLYPGFNMKFLRLVPGENDITVSANAACTIDMTCEYPVNIGA